MKTKINSILIVLMLLPIAVQAQGLAGEIQSLQHVLDTLYNDMIPLCHQLIGIGRGIAAFAALWYIASRVWRHIANAEPIDFYPLLRPFAIGLAIAFFPGVLALMNATLKPTVTGTAAMVSNSNQAIAFLLQQKEDAIKQTDTWQLYGDEGSHGKWYRYNHPDGDEENLFELVTNGFAFMAAKYAYAVKNQIKLWLSEILQVLYEAAALCINTIRTFYLIVLAILGPLVFGLAIFDGFQNTLTVWFARYINVFLWLPVANIFGAIISKIQENMLRLDIAQIEMYGDTTFSATDSAYIIFLIMGILGYFTVPSVANYIVHASGSNALLGRASNFFIGGALAATSATVAAARLTAAAFAPAAGGGEQAAAQQHAQKQTGDNAQQSKDNNSYQRDRISGK